MKLDVLSGLDEIKVCFAYELNGEKITEYPNSPSDIAKAKPIYKSLDCWKEEITEVTDFEDLPTAARKYVRFISQELKTPIDVVSVGPGRAQTLWLNSIF